MASIIIEERFMPVPGGGILYDPACLMPLMERAADLQAAALFDRSHWASRGAIQELAGRRGSVALLDIGSGAPGDGSPGGEEDRSSAACSASQAWVLRHYRRGGWAARLSTERYLWLGADRTRSFMEWRLLVRLRRRGLPVPHPVAARYVRNRRTYQADLLTCWLPARCTLAQAVTGMALPAALWTLVGRTIAAFHLEGVHHPDLNAGNILLRKDLLGPRQAGRTTGQADGGSDLAPIHLLDFDRGRLRRRGVWEARVLARLERSLRKLQDQRQDVRFSALDWHMLMAGYEQGLQSGIVAA